MSFDEKQYRRLLHWANDRLRKWKIENLTGIDLIHEALLVTGYCSDENKIRKQAEKVLNDEVRHMLSVERLINNQVIVTTVRKELLIVETKRCSLCKETKPSEEFKIVKDRYQHSHCNGCRAEYSKLYKRKNYVTKKQYRIIDTATGKKYYSLPEACKDLGLKFSTVANYFGKNGPPNKTTLKAIGR